MEKDLQNLNNDKNIGNLEVDIKSLKEKLNTVLESD